MFLPYDPGVLPTKPSPRSGESISIKVSGLPPYKDEHFSIRNPKHKIYDRFKNLRKTGIEAMAGRAPYRGAIQIDFKMYNHKFESRKTLIDYLAGIEDTLDGSHGMNFTYLPIVFEDDCQVCSGYSKLIKSEKVCYELTITFL